MRILVLFIATVLAAVTTATCVTDDCLRAVQDAAASLREEDCRSFVQVTVTAAPSTIVSSDIVTTTDTTTRKTTKTIVRSAEPSRRWLQRHEVVNVLLGRGSGLVEKRSEVPGYASACTSSAAYESACSCLGVSPITLTAPAPTTTRVLHITETATVEAIHTIIGHVNGSSLLGNSTSGKFGNLTASHLNTTSTRLFSSSGSPSRSTSSLISSSPQTSTDKYSLKRPSIEGFTSSTATPTTTSNTVSLPNNDTVTSSNFTANSSISSNATTNTGRFLNSTSSTAEFGAASVTGFRNGTIDATGISLNTTSSAPFLNLTQAVITNATSMAAQLPNPTIAAPFMNITNTPSLANISLASFLNSTHSPLLLNATTATTAPFLNSTATARFANTTISTATSTATPTSTCATTTSPFLLRVSQPGGLFDGWYLYLSGSQALFNPSADQASRFSLDTNAANNNNSSASGKSHLCSLDRGGSSAEPGLDIEAGTNSTALVAVSENSTDATGSAVYFMTPALLDEIENERQGWYAPLECSGGGAGGGNSTGGNSTTTLDCAQGAMEYWVGCGLGLDITSDEGGVAVVDGWNCTAVALAIEYS
ncbi:hypothetical protein M426DRAFT_324709 [Hypoxylon sp. CI-4A]|nr:hypothetical protein M426DRAFT_324709 [Hypoxylon sp. CI-4A]